MTLVGKDKYWIHLNVSLFLTILDGLALQKNSIICLTRSVGSFQLGLGTSALFCFFQTKVLELCCKVFPCPPSYLFQDIGLLAWLSVNEVKHFDQTMQEKTELTLSNDRDRFAWSHHQLYRTKSKEELAKLCRNMKLQSNGNKHELVRTLAENIDSVSHMLPSTMESWTPFQNNRHYCPNCQLVSSVTFFTTMDFTAWVQKRNLSCVY